MVSVKFACNLILLCMKLVYISFCQQVSVEFCKILLHLQDTIALQDFVVLRHDAMVALCCVDPEQVRCVLMNLRSE